MSGSQSAVRKQKEKKKDREEKKTGFSQREIIVSLQVTREGNGRGLGRFIVHQVNASSSLTGINTLNIKGKENKQKMAKLNG